MLEQLVTQLAPLSPAGSLLCALLAGVFFGLVCDANHYWKQTWQNFLLGTACMLLMFGSFAGIVAFLNYAVDHNYGSDRYGHLFLFGGDVVLVVMGLYLVVILGGGYGHKNNSASRA
jgi:hypothetical protein